MQILDHSPLPRPALTACGSGTGPAATSCWPAVPGTSLPGLLSPACTPSYLCGQAR